MPKEEGHFYGWDGTPHYQVPCKSRPGETRASTIADCKKNGWLPSTTTIIKRVLASPQLTEWLITEAIIAAVTTPRLQGETTDQFVARIKEVDAKNVGEKAMDMGSEVHAALEEAIAGRLYAPVYAPFVKAALEKVALLGKPIMSEKVMVHQSGYAGRVDLVTEGQDLLTVVDFKTTSAKKFPSEAYTEHLLQVASLAACLGNTGNNRVQTAVLYISTTRPGDTKLIVEPDWTRHQAIFDKVFSIYRYLVDYDPVSTQIRVA